MMVQERLYASSSLKASLVRSSAPHFRGVRGATLTPSHLSQWVNRLFHVQRSRYAESPRRSASESFPSVLTSAILSIRFWGTMCPQISQVQPLFLKT